MAAEYVLKEGNENVILCERGIRTFETAYRFTLDLTAIPVLKELSHLPVVVDPSHAAGRRDLVEPLSPGRRRGGRRRRHRGGAPAAGGGDLRRPAAAARARVRPLRRPGRARRGRRRQELPRREARRHDRVNVAVVGTGLIGGSVGLAARGRLGAHVRGVGPEARARGRARRGGRGPRARGGGGRRGRRVRRRPGLGPRPDGRRPCCSRPRRGAS